MLLNVLMDDLYLIKLEKIKLTIFQKMDIFYIMEITLLKN
jgi:hypothetical protein